MTYQSMARAVGGITTVFVLLGLTVASVIDPDIALQGEVVVLLVGLISTLLGADVASELLPLHLTLSKGGLDGGETNTSSETEEERE